MTTAAQIVRDALSHMKVQDPRQPIKAEHARDALRALNLMVRRWEANGVSLGWNDVSTIDEEISAPPEAEEALGYNLAVRLRARFRVVLDPDIIALANSGYASLKADVLANQYVRVAYDDLPAADHQPRGDWRDGLRG